MPHTCHAIGCEVTVPPKLWVCRAHWFALPKGFRDAIWATYRPGQEVTKDPSCLYLRATAQAQVYLAEREGRTVPAWIRQQATEPAP